MYVLYLRLCMWSKGSCGALMEITVEGKVRRRRVILELLKEVLLLLLLLIRRPFTSLHPQHSMHISQLIQELLICLLQRNTNDDKYKRKDSNLIHQPAIEHWLPATVRDVGWVIECDQLWLSGRSSYLRRDLQHLELHLEVPRVLHWSFHACAFHCSTITALRKKQTMTKKPPFIIRCIMQSFSMSIFWRICRRCCRRRRSVRVKVFICGHGRWIAYQKTRILKALFDEIRVSDRWHHRCRMRRK